MGLQDTVCHHINVACLPTHLPLGQLPDYPSASWTLVRPQAPQTGFLYLGAKAMVLQGSP